LLPPNSVLFVSDVHLSEHQSELTNLFLAFLQGPALQATALYILGDLFDVWVGEDISFPFHSDIHAAFKRLKANNIPIYFIAGNRDFLISSNYLQQIGCKKLPDRMTLSLHGIPTLLMHGDLLCTQDRYYQYYRKVAQHPITRFLFLMLPKETRQNIGRKLRAKSRAYQQGKPLEILDVDPATVQTEMHKSKTRQFIHGHVHRADIHSYKENGSKRIVLGDWHENKGSFVISTPVETILAEFYSDNRIVLQQSYALEAETFPLAVA